MEVSQHVRKYFERKIESQKARGNVSSYQHKRDCENLQATKLQDFLSKNCIKD